MQKPSLKKILSYLGQILLFVAIVYGLSLWQTRNMLPEKSPAPSFTAVTLSGETRSMADISGKKAVLYFFAPWCTVCRFSSHNIVSIREALDKKDVEIYAVALSYKSVEEVKAFVKEHGLTVPVLLGDRKLQELYRIGAFPSIYLIDDRQNIRSRLVGYSTELGIRLRLMLL